MTKKIKKEQQATATLYDLNKQLMKYQPILNEDAQRDAYALVENFIQDKGERYYMMLCKEKSYYTLFRFLTPESPLCKFTLEFKGCVKDCGELVSLDKTEDNAAIELWIRNEDDDSCYYFFPYDLGVIEI